MVPRNRRKNKKKEKKKITACWDRGGVHVNLF